MCELANGFDALREELHEHGDFRLTLRRTDWSVACELDVYIYDPEPAADYLAFLRRKK